VRLGRLNLTRIGVYWYTPRRTLSFSWRCRWKWWPERLACDANGGWSIWWGWFCWENLVFEEDDPWGAERAELTAAILRKVIENMEGGD